MVPTSPSGKGEIEMGGFAARRDRAAEQPLVDEGADDCLLAGAVGRHHDVEQEPRRPRSGRQPAGVDDGGKIGASEHFGLRRRDDELVEGHAIGRRDRRRCVADRCRRNAASCGQQRTCKQAAGARDIAIGDKKAGRSADPHRRERAERLNRAGHPGAAASRERRPVSRAGRPERCRVSSGRLRRAWQVPAAHRSRGETTHAGRWK